MSFYLGQPAHSIAFEYESHGRPILADSAAGLHFNLSQSGDMTVVALSLTPVGIDIERVRSIPALADVAHDHFSSQECAALLRHPPDALAHAFFVTWTRKEAFIKAMGLGVTYPLRSFSTGAPDEAPRLHAASKPLSGWSLRDLMLGPGYVGALAATHENITVHWHAADSALISTRPSKQEIS